MQFDLTNGRQRCNVFAGFKHTIVCMREGAEPGRIVIEINDFTPLLGLVPS